ncbi:MAG: helix-turn-helix domain-containing protein [bacterium]
MSMGEILRTAREERALSTSTAAEATHMKVQIIEDLEKEDFRRIAAPIYGRGFVKLYAEFLELDPAPLIREFMDLYSGKRVPVVGRRSVDGAPAPAMENETPVPITRTVRNTGGTTPPLTKPLVRTIETALATEPLPVAPAPLPLSVPTPKPAPEPDLDDDPLTLPPCLTPTRGLTVNDPETSVRAPTQAETPALEAITEDSEPSEKRWVVEPEVQFADPNGEPDLFSQHTPQRQPVTTTPIAAVEPKKKKQTIMKRGLGPIFDMGHRLDSSPVTDSPQDAETAARHNAHLKTFVDSFKRLKDAALTRGISDEFIKQYRYPLIAAGAILLICMLTGVSLLFNMTSKPVKETTSQKFQQVTPIPDMYAD